MRCPSSARGCKLASQSIFEGGGIELQLIEHAVEEHLSARADHIDAALPGLVSTVHGIVNSIHHSVVFDGKLPHTGSGVSSLLIERGSIGLLDFLTLVGRAFPG